MDQCETYDIEERKIDNENFELIFFFHETPIQCEKVTRADFFVSD